MEIISYFQSWSTWQLLGNTGDHWAVAGIVFLLTLGILYLIKFVVLKRLEALAKRTATDLDDMFIGMLKSVQWPFFWLLALFAGAKYLTLSPLADRVANYIALIIVIFYAVKSLGTIVDYAIHRAVRKKAGKSVRGQDVQRLLEREPAMRVMGWLIKGLLWMIAIALLLSNMGFNVTSLIAGLGIGGIAIAFALQRVLEDVFASFSIFLDRPFEVGDFIQVGQDSGTVEKIGVKTTRVRSAQGQLLVLSNKELTEARVNNFKKMERRRILFTLGVTYDTPVEKLELIPGTVKRIVSKMKKVTFDRAHWRQFGDSSLVFEIVYFVESAELVDYLDAQQKINIEIARAFEKEKIEFAFPTQTIHLAK